MSGVSDGQVANESTFDSAYMFANGDTGTIGVVNLNNTSNVDSGVQIVNTQRKINEIADSDGTNGEGDPNRKVYSSTNYIANGDNRKVAIGKLDTQLKLTQDDLDAAEVTIADHESRLDTIESLNSSFSGDKTFNDDVVVQGNFQVNGTKGCVNTGSGWAFTAPQSGEYEIQASLMYTNVAWTAGNTIFYNVYVNGTFVRNLYYAPIQASYTDFTPALSGSVKYNLVAGDTVSIRTFQNRGVSTALHADAKYCYVTIQKVG